MTFKIPVKEGEIVVYDDCFTQGSGGEVRSVRLVLRDLRDPLEPSDARAVAAALVACAGEVDLARSRGDNERYGSHV